MDKSNVQYKYGKASKDERAVFANRIGKLLWLKNGGDVEKVVNEFEPFWNDLEKTVRNVYELSANEVPIMGLYELRKFGADNFGFSDEEHAYAISVCIAGCKKYYE